MKKIYIFSMIATLAMGSCSKEEVTEDYTPAIAGTWKISKIAQISGKDGHIISSVTLADCDVKNTYEFRKDNSFVFTYFSGGNCENTNTEEGTYDYQNSPSVNKLYIKYNGETEVEENIVQKLTELELQYYSSTLEDYNNDGVMDKEVVYMHH